MRYAVLLSTVAALAACASLPDPTAALIDPQVRVRYAGDDVIREYRASGRPGRIVKITPANGLPFYLFDDNDDERIDRHLGDIPPKYRDALRFKVRFEDYGLMR